MKRHFNCNSDFLWHEKLFLMFKTWVMIFFFLHNFPSSLFSTINAEVFLWEWWILGIVVCLWLFRQDVSLSVCLDRLKSGDLQGTSCCPCFLSVMSSAWCCADCLLTSLSHLQQVSWCTVCTAGRPAQTWMCVETWGGCKLTPLSPLKPGATWSRSPDTSSAQPSCGLTVCSHTCNMADAGAWRTHQDGPQILQRGPSPGQGSGPGSAPNRVWISLIAGEIVTSSVWH